MTGYKAEIRAAPEDVERLTCLFSEMLDPPPAISTRETDGGWLIELYFEALPDRAALNAVAGCHERPDAIISLRLDPLPGEDWVALTQQGLHPIRAGRFFVHGSHDRHRAASEPFAIEIDAGQAFGTAHHGTTRGCLVMLDRLAKAKRYTAALDLGTGSGVLAIAAAKSLSRQVIAADIDPVAVRVARQNFALNGVKDRVRALHASRPDHPGLAASAPFPLIVANILAGPLIRLAPGLRRITARGGDLILSGLLDHQAGTVQAHYRAQGYVSRASLSIEGWTTLLMRYSGADKEKAVRIAPDGSS